MIQFRQARKVTAATVVALVLASVSFSAAYAWGNHLHDRDSHNDSAIHDHDSPASVFTISSNIYTTPLGSYPSTSCFGSPALFYPGVTRCMVLSVHNNLSRPITVQSITIRLDPSFPAPPGVCSGANLTLPTFSGALTVSGGSTLAGPGLPISLNESHTNQDACKNFTYHFSFSGMAQYSDASSTILVSSPNPSTFKQTVAFTVTVGNATPGAELSAPSGPVTLLLCLTATCSTTTPLGTQTTGTNGRVKFNTSSLPVGTNFVEAVFAGEGTDFTSSTSNVLTQVVKSSTESTSISVSSSPNPTVATCPVTLTATVVGSSSEPQNAPKPSGTVSFFSGTVIGSHSLLGTTPLNSNGKATLSVSGLPIGSTDIYAVYNGDSKYSSSTSALIVQVVLAKPPTCTGNYSNWFYGGPNNPNLQGSGGNNFFYAAGGSYQASGSDGDNCFDGGDGDDHYRGGNGHNTVHCGNGNNIIELGNGNNQIDLGSGSNVVSVGDGNNSVTVGNGSHGHYSFGNGNDNVILGNGSYNTIQLGGGLDPITISGGSNDSVTGFGNDVVYLGAGSNNSFTGSSHHTNVCHLPTPPSSWRGSAVSYYHDTITNCTVVTP